jgi:molybdopterin-guanine dinucleotide biosynthesis protein A
VSAAFFGIFVGGGSRRMGGVPKGLLPTRPGESSIVEHLVSVSQRALPDARIALIGRTAAYAGLGLPIVADDPEGIGPIGGLCAALRWARGGTLVSVACDMPRISVGLVRSLLGHAPLASAVAPRVDSLLQPLFARYTADAVLPVVERAIDRGDRALYSVLEALGAEFSELPLGASEAALLGDWDTPEDMLR